MTVYVDCDPLYIERFLVSIGNNFEIEENTSSSV